MKFRKILMTLLKICGAVILLAIIIGASSMGYNEYVVYERQQAELTYQTDRQWQWHQEREDIQIDILDDDFVGDPSRSDHTLRKVVLWRKYYVEAYKNADYTLEARIHFIADCQPNTNIETSSKFSDGQPKKLYCNDAGDELSLSITWEEKGTRFVWSEDFDGFKFSVDFKDWNFTELDKEVTLSKAKPDPRIINLVFEGDDEQ